jgi:hypothetical protein
MKEQAAVVRDMKQGDRKRDGYVKQHRSIVFASLIPLNMD